MDYINSSNTQDPLPDIEEEINHNQSIQKRKKKRTLRFDTSDPEDQGSSRSSFRYFSFLSFYFYS